jgi:hypothetical protein
MNDGSKLRAERRIEQRGIEQWSLNSGSSGREGPSNDGASDGVGAEKQEILEIEET